MPAGCVSDRKLICLQINTLSDTGSVKKKQTGLSRSHIDPHFFKDNKKAVMVNSERFVSIIVELFSTQTQRNRRGG